MKLFRSLIILILFASNVSGQERKETLKITLAEQYPWKIETDKQDSTVHTRVLSPEDENGKKHGFKVILKRDDAERFIPMEIAMNSIVNKLRQKSPKLAMKLIERDKDEKNHWIIFKIESVSSHNNKNLESRLYYVIQGNNALFTNYVSVSGKTLPDELTERWKAAFKNSLLEYDASVTDQLRL